LKTHPNRNPLAGYIIPTLVVKHFLVRTLDTQLPLTLPSPPPYKCIIISSPHHPPTTQDEYEQHGTYRGLCSPGFFSQPLESPAQQRYLKLPAGLSGCIVVKLEPSSDAGEARASAPICFLISLTRVCFNQPPTSSSNRPNQPTAPPPISPPPHTHTTARVLEVNDVILEVDGVPIAGDETMPFRDDERLDYSHGGGGALV
jgi:hypothetical protein